MQTQCRPQSFLFQDLGSRSVVAAFDGGTITSDAGLLLLRELESKRRIIRLFASAFRDHRDPLQIEHTVEQLLAQRVFALCCGYDDLNDHDTLCSDPCSPPPQARPTRRARRVAAQATAARLVRVDRP